MSRRKPTLKDIAKLSGVSIATVSWALNGTKARIPQKTRDKVIKAAKEIGYYPNVPARNLAQRTSDILGFVTDDVATSPFAGKIIAGAQEEAWKNNKVLLIVNTDGQETIENEAFSMMLEQQVQGIIYSTWYHRRVNTPTFFSKMPSLFVNCFSDDKNIMSIVPNEVQGGKTATDMLIQKGHKRIAFINTTTPSPAHTYRLKGYYAALKAAGLPFSSSLVINTEPNQEGGFKITNNILQLGVTGIFCHNDRVAMGLYDGLKRRNIDVPHDVSIVGFDNQEVISSHLHPKLSTVELPHFNLGKIGVQELLKKINDQRIYDKKHLIKVKCPPVVRKSISLFER